MLASNTHWRPMMRMGRMLGSTRAGGRTAGLTLSASDWPQWRGPRRDGIAAETGLLKTGRPKDRRPCGARLAPATATPRSRLPAAASTRWVRKGPGVRARVRRGNRKTPLGDADRRATGAGPRRRAAGDADDRRQPLSAIRGRGDLACMDVASGKKLWGVPSRARSRRRSRTGGSANRRSWSATA